MPRGYLKEKEYRMTDISDYIRKLMRDSKITQADIAKVLGITQPRVSQKLDTCEFDVSELLIIFKLLKADQDKVGRLFILRRADEK